MSKKDSPLIRIDENDYALIDVQGVWIQVYNLSVHILPGDIGVRIEVYPLGDELNNELGSLHVPFQTGR